VCETVDTHPMRRSSRFTVEVDLPIAVAICRIPAPVLRRSAIWTRGSSEKKRAEIADSRTSTIGG